MKQKRSAAAAFSGIILILAAAAKYLLTRLIIPDNGETDTWVLAFIPTSFWFVAMALGIICIWAFIIKSKHKQ